MPTQLHSHGWRDWFAAAKGVWRALDEKNLGLIAAGVAFFGVFAVFPALAAIIAIWGLISEADAVLAQLALVETILPEQVYALLRSQILFLTGQNSVMGWATIVSLAAALWSARAGAAALNRGLNAVYGRPNRTGLRYIFQALGMTVSLILVALAALAAVVVLPVVLAFLPLGPFAAAALTLVQWLIAIGVLVAALGLVYRYGPNRRDARMPWLTPGALVAVVLWVATSAGFSLYLSNFGRYNEIYGSIGAVIALLMWLYLSAFIILLGAAINAELEKQGGG